MRRQSWMWIAGVAWMMAACAAKPPMRADYGRLPPLDSGWSRIYVSAGKLNGTKLSSVHEVGPVYINDKLVGTSARDEYFVVDVLPGIYQASCSPQVPEKNYSAKQQFTLTAGETRYLACDMEQKGTAMPIARTLVVTSNYLSETRLTEAPLDPVSRLVDYKKVGFGSDL